MNPSLSSTKPLLSHSLLDMRGRNDAHGLAVLSHLRATPSSLSPGPATVSDGSAVGLQQPVPRHRHYNYSVHREPEFSSFSGLPFYKGDVDNAAQVTLQQFYSYCRL